ncbi:partial Swarming motility regulation sensor protein RssA, partial [Rhodocyclaceae bacterium]
GDLATLAEARRQDLGIAGSEPVTVHGDAHALRMLLRNLVDNALRYTPEGGRVDVTVGRAAGAPFLQVTDTGPGIAPADRERVFDRFYRVAGAGAAGTGLGLAIAQSIVKNHHANIGLGDNPDGPGLRVTVRFPAPPGALRVS